MNYTQAQEIQYAELAEFDIVIAKIKGYKTPVRVTRTTDSTVWYELLQFKGLAYEGDNQVATYHRYGDRLEHRLSKANKAKFYLIPTDPFSHDNEFKHIGDSTDYEWIKYEAPVVAQQPPNA